MSTISEELKTIFIHVPKNAGTSMEDMGFLGTVMTRHFGIDHYDKQVDIDKYFKFAFVRNPYDRLRSGICQHPLGGTRVTYKKFNEFIQKNKAMLDKWIATKPQYTFVCIDGKVRVDFIGRFENLQRDWARVCNRLKINETLTLAHFKMGRYPKDLGYTKENKELVRKIYAKDFDLFNYEK